MIRRQHMLRYSRRGLTLVEVQIALLVVFLTLIAATSLYIFGWRSFAIGNDMLDIYSNSRVAIELIARDIRWAAQVVPSVGGYTTSDSTIVLQVPAIDSVGNTIPSHYDYIIYRLQGNDLYRTVQKDSLSSRASEDRVVAHYCSTLAFSSGGTGLSGITNLSTINTVSVYLPLNKATISLSGAGSEVISLTPTTTVRLRNK